MNTLFKNILPLCNKYFKNVLFRRVNIVHKSPVNYEFKNLTRNFMIFQFSDCLLATQTFSRSFITAGRLCTSSNHEEYETEDPQSENRGEYEMKDPQSEEEVVNITYIDRDGNIIPIRGKIGDNVLYLAHRYEIDLEGACSASLACSTCHVYVDYENFEKLPEPKLGEDDMLELASFLRDNSRLGCQIFLTKELDGMTLQLPSGTRNFYVDGHKPKPH